MSIKEPESSIPCRIYGEGIEPTALSQIHDACRLPVSVAASLMPDAHTGYGLPIGGVLATRKSVIPYAVGVDIACRVMISILDIPPLKLEQKRKNFISALESETKFGVGGTFKEPNQHEVLDEDWSISPVTKQLKDTAREQLGTSGSGNHFVEFGTIEVFEPLDSVKPGVYTALVSHSGSRGPGARVADHYSRLAKQIRQNEIPKELHNLSWLDLYSEGSEYWAAMELMGKFASANHHVIHRRIIGKTGAELLHQVENHHNFAWKEFHNGEEVIVHRKGATPAGKGIYGYIPGTMVHPGYLVEGLGNVESLTSASHGAGRRMSRTRAKQSISRERFRKMLKDYGVHLISAGMDEAPDAYKDIDKVIAQQNELVKLKGKFTPKIVKMAQEGERSED